MGTAVLPGNARCQPDSGSLALKARTSIATRFLNPEASSFLRAT